MRRRWRRESLVDSDPDIGTRRKRRGLRLVPERTPPKRGQASPAKRYSGRPWGGWGARGRPARLVQIDANIACERDVMGITICANQRRARSSSAAIGRIADVPRASRACQSDAIVTHQSGRFSNRLSRVKHFQAIHHLSVDVAHGLALLSGLGTQALPSWDSKTRWNNRLGVLAVNLTAGPSDRTNSPHPSSREGHHSTVGWISGFSPI